MLRRLLTWLGFVFVQPIVDLSWRREPFFGPSPVIDLDKERLRRHPVVFVGYMSEPCKTLGRY